MRFTSTIAAAVLSLAGGSQAWSQDPRNGIWVANNIMYNIRDMWVHESCTRMNTDTVLSSGSCSYWTDDQGGFYNGHCTMFPGQVLCIQI
ncbi:hypothetical protein C8A01DRAFT_37069 [Parachaetomium inaequale]|uniref:Uncharacterized protein n=1 Tax=Parachaetomium inaequale TaxID=2588326 RepID=A0AAN6PH93_9PEZI|nr:hypothetical protein C8A01DRAFT_37069 [Parachaetomium inaequale]